MKHGDKAKAKSAKAIKASAKKSSKTGKGREAKTGKGGKAEVKAKSGTAKTGTAKSSTVKTSTAKAESKASSKASSKPSGGNGKNVKRALPETFEFSNPIVAAAFKRAVKKYPNAFRRLTD